MNKDFSMRRAFALVLVTLMLFGLVPLQPVAAEEIPQADPQAQQDEFLKMPVIDVPIEGDMTLTGCAEPGSLVKLWFDNSATGEPAVTAEATPDGTFTLQLNSPFVKDQVFTLRADKDDLLSRENSYHVSPKTAVIGRRKRVAVVRESSIKNGGFVEREPDPKMKIGQLSESALAGSDGKVRYFEMIWNTKSDFSPVWSMKGGRVFYDFGDNAQYIQLIASRGFSALHPIGSGWRGVSQRHMDQQKNNHISEALLAVDQMESVFSTPVLQDDGIGYDQPRDPFTNDSQGGWLIGTGADGKVGVVRFYLKPDTDEAALENFRQNGMRVRSWTRKKGGAIVKQLNRAVLLHTRQSQLPDVDFSQSEKFLGDGNATYRQTPALGGINYDPQKKTLSTIYELTKAAEVLHPILATTDLYIKMASSVAELVDDISVNGKSYKFHRESVPGSSDESYLIIPDVHKMNGEQDQEMIGKAIGPYDGNFVFHLTGGGLQGVLTDQVNSLDFEFELRDRSLSEGIDQKIKDFTSDKKLNKVNDAINTVWAYAKQHKKETMTPEQVYRHFGSQPGQPGNDDYADWLAYAAYYPDEKTIQYTENLVKGIRRPLKRRHAQQRLEVLKKIMTYIGVVDDNQRINNTLASNYLFASDYDRDGLLDQYESQIGLNTNYASPDTDADGVLDAEEFAQNRDPIIHAYEWYDSSNEKVTGLSSKSTTLSGNVGNYSYQYMKLGYMFPRRVELWKVKTDDAGHVTEYVTSIAETDSNKDLNGSFLLHFPEGSIQPGDKLVVKYITNEVKGKLEEDDEEDILQVGYSTPEVSEVYTVPDKTELAVDHADQFGVTFSYITGTTEPHAVVKITFPNKSILTIEADEKGHFKGLINDALPQVPELAIGDELLATAKADGKSISDTVTINVVASSPKPTIEKVKEGDAFINGTVGEDNNVNVAIEIKRDGQVAKVPDAAITVEEDGTFKVDVQQIPELGNKVLAGDVITVTATKDALPPTATETTVVSSQFNIDNFKSFEILEKPQQKYIEGDTLNLTGLQVKLIDSDDNFTLINVASREGHELTDLGFKIALENKANSTGEGGLTATGSDNVILTKGDVQKTFEITVSPKVFNPEAITAIKIIQPPTKMTYEEGELFEAVGLKVELTDNGNLTKEVEYKDFAAYNLELMLEVEKGKTKENGEIFRDKTPLDYAQHHAKRLYVFAKKANLEAVIETPLTVTQKMSAQFELPEIETIEKTVGETITRGDVKNYLDAKLKAYYATSDPKPAWKIKGYSYGDGNEETDQLLLQHAGNFNSPIVIEFTDGSTKKVGVPVNVTLRELKIAADPSVNPNNRVTEEAKAILIQRTEEKPSDKKPYPLTEDASYRLVIANGPTIVLTFDEAAQAWTSNNEAVAVEVADNDNLKLTFNDNGMDLIRGQKTVTIQRFGIYGSYSNVLTLTGPEELQSRKPANARIEDPESENQSSDLIVTAGDPAGFKIGDIIIVKVGDNKPVEYAVTKENLNEDKTVTLKLDLSADPHPLPGGTTVTITVQEKKPTQDAWRPVSDSLKVTKGTSAKPEAKFGDDTSAGNTTVVVTPTQEGGFKTGDKITVKGPGAEDKQVVTIGDEGVTVDPETHAVTVDLGRKLTDGQKVQVTVTEKDKAPSEAVELTKKNIAKPTIDKFTEGDETIGVTPGKDSDKITITLPGKPAKVIELTKDENNNWTDGTNTYTPDEKTGKINVKVPEGTELKPNDVIKVDVEDKQGNKNTGETEVQAKPTSMTPTAKFGDNTEGGNTTVVVTPKHEGGFKAGDKITVKGPGAEDELVVTIGDEGVTVDPKTGTVTVDLGQKLTDGQKVQVTVTEKNKAPSEAVELTQKNIAEPTIDKFTEGDDTIGVTPGEDSDKITITIPGTPETVIELEKNKDGNWVDPKNPGHPLKPDKNGKILVPIPEGTDPQAGSKINVEVEDKQGNKNNAETTVQAKPESAKPEAKFGDDTAGGNTAVVVTPKQAGGFKTGDKIMVKDPVTGTTKTVEVGKDAVLNDDGTVTVDLGRKLTDGQKVQVTVTEKGKAPSEAVELTKKNIAKPTIDPITEGDETIGVTPGKDSDRITIKIPGTPEKVIELEKKDDGNWTDGTNIYEPDKTGKINVKVPEGTELKHNDVIKVDVEDKQGNKNNAETTVQAKPESAKPKAKFGDNTAGGNTTVVVTPKQAGGFKTGDKITVKDPVTGTTKTVEVGKDAVLNDDGTVTVDLGRKLTDGQKVQVTVTEKGKAPSKAVELTKSTPQLPTIDPITEGDDTIGVTPGKDSDKITIKIPGTPETVIELEKKDDGNWTDGTNTYTPDENGKINVKVPEGTELKPKDKINVEVEDNQGNKNNGETTVQAKPESAKPEAKFGDDTAAGNTTVVVTPTQQGGFKTGDQITVKDPVTGTTKTVEVGKDAVLNDNGTVTVDLGQKLTDGQKVQVTVTENGKAPSEAVELTKKNIAEPEIDEFTEGDETIGVTPGKDSDKITITLPGEPETVIELTKDENNNWTDGTNTYTPDENGKILVPIPEGTDPKAGSKIKVDVEDKQGNKNTGETEVQAKPTSMTPTAKFGDNTEGGNTTVVVTPKHEGGFKAGDKITVKGPGAEDELVVTIGDEGVTVDPKTGTVTVDLGQKLTDGQKVQVTVTENGKAPSEAVELTKKNIAEPEIDEFTEGDETIGVTPGKDSDKITITLPGKPAKVIELTKDENNNWTDGTNTYTPDENGKINVKVPEGTELKPNDVIKVDVEDKQGNKNNAETTVQAKPESAEPKAKFGDDTAAGNTTVVVTPTQQGGFKTGDQITVKGPGAEDKKVVTIGDEGVTVDPKTGTITVDLGQKLADGQKVQVTVTEKDKAPSKAVELTKQTPAAPTVDDITEGDTTIKVTPSKDAQNGDKITITIPESEGTPAKTIVLEKKNDAWVDESGKAYEVGEDGKITLDTGRELKKNEEVTVTTEDKQGNKTETTITVAEKPTSMTPTAKFGDPENGKDTVEVSPENGKSFKDGDVIEVKDAKDTVIGKVTVKTGPEGNVKDGKVIVPLDKSLTDGATIKVTVTQPGHKPSEAVELTKKNIAKPTIDPITEGDDTIGVTPGKDSDKITITISGTPETVIELTKDENNNWTDGTNTYTPDENGKINVKVPEGTELKPKDKINVEVEDNQGNKNNGETTVQAKPESAKPEAKFGDDTAAGNTTVVVTPTQESGFKTGDKITVKGPGAEDKKVVTIGDEGVTVDPETHAVTVDLGRKLTDGQKVQVTVTENGKAPSEAVELTKKNIAKPTIDKFTEGDDTIGVTPGKDSDKITITLPGEPAKVIELTKDENNNWTDGTNTYTPDEKTGKINVKVPEGTELKPNDVIKVDVEDKQGNKNNAETTVQAKPESAKPEAKFGDNTAGGNTTVVVTPTQEGGFKTGDKITVKGPSAEDELVVTIGDEGVTVDPKTGTVTVDLGRKLTDGQKVQVTVTEKGKAPSEAVELTKSTPQLPTIDPITEGDDTIGVTPGEDSDKITITVLGEPETVIELTKDENNNWTDGTNTYTPDENGKINVKIPEGTELKPNDKINVEVEDKQGNKNNAETTVQAKPESAKPEVKFGDDTAAGNTTVVVTPTQTGGFKTGDKITVKDPATGTTKTVEVGKDAVLNENGTVTVDLGRKLTDGQKVQVTVTENGKAPSQAVELTKSTPQLPTIDPITEGDDTIGVTPGADSDKITITIPGTPETVIELEKDNDGNWVDPKNPDHPLKPDKNGKILVPIPEGTDPQAGEKIKIDVEDNQGNKNTGETTVAEKPKVKSPTPQLTIMTSNKNATNVEAPGNTVLTVTPGGETPQVYVPGDVITIAVPSMGQVKLTYTVAGWTLTENTTGKEISVISGDGNTVKVNLGNEIPGTTELSVTNVQGEGTTSDPATVQVPTDKSGLTEAINEAGDKLPGEYADGTPEKNLNDAIDKANEILNKEDATQKEIDDATEALKQAKDYYDNYKTPQPTATTKSTPATDSEGNNGKTELNVVPGTGHTFKLGDRITVDIPRPTPEDPDAKETRIFVIGDPSVTVNNDGSATIDLGNDLPGDIELTVTVEEMTETGEFKAPSDPLGVPVQTDKSELKKALDSAGEKVPGEPGTPQDRLNHAIDEANRVLNDPHATQSEIDHATQELYNAKKAVLNELAKLFVNEITAAAAQNPENLLNAVDTTQLPAGTFIRKEVGEQPNTVNVTLRYGGETINWVIQVPTTLPEEGDPEALRAKGLIIDLNDPTLNLDNLTADELRQHVFLGNGTDPATAEQVTMQADDLNALLTAIEQLKSCPAKYDATRDDTPKSLSVRFNLSDGVERNSVTGEQDNLLQIAKERLQFETFHQMFEDEVWYAIQDYKAYLDRTEDNATSGPTGGVESDTTADESGMTTVETQANEDNPSAESVTSETTQTETEPGAATSEDATESTETAEVPAVTTATTVAESTETTAEGETDNGDGGSNEDPTAPFPELFHHLVATLEDYEASGLIDPQSLVISGTSQPTEFDATFTVDGKDVTFDVDVASEANLMATEPAQVVFDLWATQLTLTQADPTAEPELTTAFAEVLAGDRMEAQFFADYNVPFKDVIGLDQEDETSLAPLGDSPDHDAETAHIDVPILVIPAKCPAQNTLYEPKAPETKVPVNDTANLTEEEKQQVREAVEKANTDLPEGTTITIGADGTATITYPDGTQDSIDGDLLVVEKPDNEKYDPKAPATKVPVNDRTNLTEAEKQQVKEAVENANPDLPAGTTITIGADGTATITYPDGTQDTIDGNLLVREKADNEKYDPQAPGVKVPVADTDHLTEAEKQQVKEAVEKANPDLPEGTTITIGDDGTATITYPDGTQDQIDGTELVQEKGAPPTDADQNDPQAPGVKVPVADTDHLTDAEKQQVKEAVEKANPGLPAGTTITIGDDGSATITYPDGSKDHIDGKDLVRAFTDAERLDPKPPTPPISVRDNTHLTAEEKERVVMGLRLANPNLPSGTFIDVADDGTATILYPDGSRDVIPGELNVVEYERKSICIPPVWPHGQGLVDAKTKQTLPTETQVNASGAPTVVTPIPATGEDIAVPLTLGFSLLALAVALLIYRRRH